MAEGGYQEKSLGEEGIVTIIDELAGVIEARRRAQVGPVTSRDLAHTVLDHLAAKAGDVRGMLPAPRDVGRRALRTEPVDGETHAEWYTRAGDAVLDLCAERIAPIVGALRGEGQTFRVRAGMPKPDEPIADPAERAKAVARILRGRGIWASAAPDLANTTRAAWYVSVEESDGSRWYPWCASHEETDAFDRWCPMGPSAIADAIQAEEARRAQEWAGDETMATEDAVDDRNQRALDYARARLATVEDFIKRSQGHDGVELLGFEDQREELLEEIQRLERGTASH